MPERQPEDLRSNAMALSSPGFQPLDSVGDVSKRGPGHGLYLWMALFRC